MKKLSSLVMEKKGIRMGLTEHRSLEEGLHRAGAQNWWEVVIWLPLVSLRVCHIADSRWAKDAGGWKQLMML